MTSPRNITSTQELSNLFNESGLIPKLNQTYFQGEFADTGKVQEELLAWFNENNVHVDGKKFTLNDIEIHEGGNNFNIMIKKGNVGLVMQFGLRPPAVDESMQFLTSSGERPKWLAHQYAQQTFTGSSQYISLNSPRSDSKHEENRFETGNLGVLTVQELCPATLKGKVAELHSAKDNANTTDIIKLASRVGQNMGAMFSDINGNNLLWTDIKAGNILFHPDGSIAIADIKAFTPIEKMPYRRVKGGKTIINYSGLVTEGFLSDHIRRNELGAELKREQLQSVWEKEYSFQLGVLLHYVATGSEYVSPRFALDPYEALDFSKGVFAKKDDGKFINEDGERLQYIIERLIDHNPIQKEDKKNYFQTNPDNRIHYSQAMQLLEVISNKDAFAAKVKEIEQQNKDFKSNNELRKNGKQEDIKLPNELVAMRKSIADIKPNYEKRMLGIKHKLSKKNTTSMQEKYAVMEALNKKAEELIAQHPMKSVAQIQTEMQTYLRHESITLENQQHYKSALHKYVRSAIKEIHTQQAEAKPLTMPSKPKPKAEVKETIPLKVDEYIKLYFANTSKTVRNRPFDTSHYKDKEAKTAGEYGTNAKAWKLSDIKIDEINTKSITALKSVMENVLKDIEPFIPESKTDSDNKAIQSLKAGYIFNAFNQKMLAELKNNISDERKSELKQQAELVRFIVDDLVAGKPVQESLNRLEERNINKIKFIAHRSIYNELVRHEDMTSTIRQEELNALNLAGIDKDKFVSRLRSFAVIGEVELNKQLDPTKGKSTLHRQQVQSLREVLSDAWARTAVKIDSEITNKSKYPMVGVLNGEQERAINGHELTKDYRDLLLVTEGVLSITKFYATAIGAKLLNSEDKEKLLVQINNKLSSLIAHYPFHPDTGLRVTANDIRLVMRDELAKHVKDPAFSGLIEKHMDRVINRQTAILDLAKKPQEVLDERKEGVKVDKPKVANDSSLTSSGKKFG